jgi:dUTP pyrophosphatase
MTEAMDLVESIQVLPIKVICASPQWVPVYQSPGASGADLLAAIETEIEIMPGKTALIPTGLRIEVPEGFEVQVRSRSGLALKSQVSVLNSPGTIDSDYRGEIGVILMNHSQTVFTVKPGMRIAQMVVVPVVRAQFIPSLSLTDTDRGQGGFGHTGV